MIKDKKIKVIVERTRTGFSAFAQDHEVYIVGKTFAELKQDILEALNFYFEDAGIKISPKQIALEIDLKQFFQYYRVINAKFLAERIGMNPTLLSQYVQGRKKPSAQQTEKIIEGLNEIGKELSELNFTIN